MLAPAGLPDFFAAFFSAALIILAGACYALFYAWARLAGKRSLLLPAGGFYLVLIAATFALSRALHLEGHWLVLIALMLLGYLFAPPAIWRLCAATHADDDRPLPDSPTQEKFP